MSTQHRSNVQQHKRGPSVNSYVPAMLSEQCTLTLLRRYDSDGLHMDGMWVLLLHDMDMIWGSCDQHNPV